MHRHLPFYVLCVLFTWTAFAMNPISGWALDEQEQAAEESSDNADKSEEVATVTVETEELVATLSSSGLFVGTEYDEIILDPQAWTTLKVVKAVAHGSTVMEGDPILILESEDLDEAIEKAQYSLESTELSLRLAEDELRFLKESTAMDLEQSERTAKQAQDDLTYYLEVEEQEDIKSAELTLKFAEYSLEYAQEELDQLQKMYEADDLTEETEEIILLRAQRDVEMAQRNVDRAKLRRDRQITTLIPREKINKQNSEARALLNRAKSVATLPLMLQKKEMDVEQLKRSLDEQKEKLAELEADQSLMIVNAPRSGIVYYGKATHGSWSEVATRAKQLIPGGTVAAKSVLMTIVDPEHLVVLADVDESQLSELQTGQLALVEPKSDSALKMYAQVNAISHVAESDKKYKATLILKRDEPETDALVAGMTCSVKVLIKKTPDAIMIPEGMIHRDDFTENDGAYVWRAGEEPQKQFVTLGLKREGKFEILEGLSAGDEILKKAP